MKIIGLGTVEPTNLWLTVQVFLHMVGNVKDLFAKTLIQGSVNAVNGTSMPIVCKGKMNVEVVPNVGT